MLLCFLLPNNSAAENSLPTHTAQTDTVPSNSIFRKIGDYLKELKTETSRQPTDSNAKVINTVEIFKPYSGRTIRSINYTGIDVFGPSDITDTAFTTKMKLIHLANKMHHKSRKWVIRESLFFRQNDTINAYELAENERYLRNRPFIQDARIYITPTAFRDSVDVYVVTKDVFAFGGRISDFSTSSVGGLIYNNNIFGTSQAIRGGLTWDEDANPEWGGQAEYTKYNLAGSFMDFSAGFTQLNNYHPIDTGVYEGSYYINVSRPLYRSSARMAGGLLLSKNFSINKYDLTDSLYRDYSYTVFDGWLGYNFRNRFSNNGIVSDKPNLAVLLRMQNRHFENKPNQDRFFSDPYYNDRQFILTQFAVFKQEFFKSSFFFGFGRTEDIPLGYSLTLSTGIEKWAGFNRLYTGVEAQKFWITPQKSLINTDIGIGTFWRKGKSEDAVIQAKIDYYSHIINIDKASFRQFVSASYLGNPNHHLYRPLNINELNGIIGYDDTQLNGYQRLNLRSETIYYSPLIFYGFKFNFFALLQASQLANSGENVLSSRLYSSLGLGFRVKNENLPWRTLRLSANYFPNSPMGVKPWAFEVSTSINLGFDLNLLKAPSFLSFR